MKPYLVMANILLLTLTAYWGVGGFYAAVVSPGDSDLSAGVVAKTEVIKTDFENVSLSAYGGIVTRNLFKVVTDQAKKKREPSSGLQVDGLKPTRLKLSLLGTISAGNKDQLAWAVIQEKGSSKQNLYHVGDSIKNAKLKLILRERVILAIDGQDEVLEMEKVVQGSTAKATRATRPALSANISLNRATVEKATADMNQLMRQIRLRPNFSKGRADGLRLSRVPPNSILRQMKLRSGDIITAINGEPLTSLNDAPKLYEGLKSGDPLELTIKRNGRNQTLNYRF
jgi:general secretion pathway protein C